MSNEPTPTDVVRAASEGTAKAFLTTVGGPAVELSSWLSDVIREWRFRTQVKILQRAKEMLDDAGLSAHVVPAKTLVPLLELGGLEEESNEEMHERWAALLANAASDEAPDVPPSFTRILSELTPPEAQMLEWLAQHRGGSALHTFKQQAGYDYTSDKPQPEYDVYVDNLERHKLIEVTRQDPRQQAFQRDLVRKIQEMEAGGPGALPIRPLGARTVRAPNVTDSVHVTALGRAFVVACTPPGAPTDAQEALEEEAAE
jgi:hypothetical protein